MKLHEIAKTTLASYISKASQDAADLASRAAYKLAGADTQADPDDDGEKDDHKAWKRLQGVKQAANKLTDKGSIIESSNDWNFYNGNILKGKLPPGVEADDIVEVKFRDKDGIQRSKASDLRWSWGTSWISSTQDIMYYRVVDKAHVTEGKAHSILKDKMRDIEQRKQRMTDEEIENRNKRLKNQRDQYVKHNPGTIYK